MAYRWHPAGADVDPDDPRAWGTCDRCGRIYNLYKLTWQYDFRGSNQLQNTRLLVCPPCYDAPQPQLAPYILPPDPPPIFNARPENYTLDETSWLSTQDEDVITTQSDDPLITPVADNPSSSANTAALIARLSYPGGSVSVAYLDLFNGNPAAGGVSVLSAITGSSVRTDIASELSINGSNAAINPDVITISSASESVTNVNYIGIYSASISGSLLVSGPVAVSGQTIGVDTVVQFNALGLFISLS